VKATDVITWATWHNYKDT